MRSVHSSSCAKCVRIFVPVQSAHMVPIHPTPQGYPHGSQCDRAASRWLLCCTEARALYEQTTARRITAGFHPELTAGGRPHDRHQACAARGRYASRTPRNDRDPIVHLADRRREQTPTRSEGEHAAAERDSV